MRPNKSIEITLKIPAIFDDFDNNKIFYTKSSVENALKSYKNSPVVLNYKNKSFIIGVITEEAEIIWENDKPKIKVEGFLFDSGTNDTIIESEQEIIKSYKVKEFGIQTL